MFNPIGTPKGKPTALDDRTELVVYARSGRNPLYVIVQDGVNVVALESEGTSGWRIEMHTAPVGKGPFGYLRLRPYGQHDKNFFGKDEALAAARAALAYSLGDWMRYQAASERSKLIERTHRVAKDLVFTHKQLQERYNDFKEVSTNTNGLMDLARGLDLMKEAQQRIESAAKALKDDAFLDLGLPVTP
jgi:hypothetical protein